jgi:hypothetical protein
MLEAEGVLKSCQTGLNIALYMRSLLLVESFDMLPGN